jgi:CheY-like chemotaxis protein
MLQHAGATAVVAASADEAFEVFGREPADAVVSDVGMPVRDGRALVQQIRALPDAERRRVPVIALTAFARTRDRIDALAMGFDAHVAKPVEAEELVLLLARLLRRDLPA